MSLFGKGFVNLKYITIGNVKIEQTAALAPMASVADKAMRLMCKRYGAAMLTGEMASAKGLCYSDRKTEELLAVSNEERPMAVQLFGSEPEFMAKAAVIAARYKPDFIDINCGCPVPKVAGNGSGSALMKDPALLGKIVSAVVKATDIPVTVKIRKGWDDSSVNAVEVAKIVEDSGAAAIAVHGRTKNQMYSGTADLDIIAAVKQAVRIPVIGNGDVDSVSACVKMYEYTGCDLVMIGRGACGRPWLFGQIKKYYETGELIPPPPLCEQLDIMTRHIELLAQFKGEYIGMKEARKHTAWYLKGWQNAAKYRGMCGTLSTLDDFYALVAQIRQELGIDE